MKNDFNYKWSKIFASKRFKREDGFVLLSPIEQHELLNDAESLVKKLTIKDIGNQTIDLSKVERVGSVGGASSWLRYTVYFTGGNNIEIYEEHRDGLHMKREEFVKLWREVNAT